MQKWVFLRISLLQSMGWASVPRYVMERRYSHDGSRQGSMDALDRARFASFCGDRRAGLQQGATWIRLSIHPTDHAGCALRSISCTRRATAQPGQTTWPHPARAQDPRTGRFKTPYSQRVWSAKKTAYPKRTAGLTSRLLPPRHHRP